MAVVLTLIGVGTGCLLKAQLYTEGLVFLYFYFPYSCFKYCAIDVAFVFLHRLLVLQSEVEHSLERFLKIRKKLTNLKVHHYAFLLYQINSIILIFLKNHYSLVFMFFLFLL